MRNGVLCAYAYKRGSSLLVSTGLGEFEGLRLWNGHDKGSTPFLCITKTPRSLGDFSEIMIKKLLILIGLVFGVMMEMYAQTAEQLYNTAQKEKDTTKATQLYKKSAEMGYAPAQYQYAKRLCNPYALSWSKEAKEMYNNAAKQHYIPAVIDVTGHAIACMNYFKAIFVHNRHLFYYRSRLDTNNIQTYFDLCDLHKASHGGGKWNRFWGRKWVEKSGNFAKTAEDFYCVGLYSKEFRKRSYDGYDYFVKAADLGDGRACFEVIKANLYYRKDSLEEAQKQATIEKYANLGIPYYQKLAQTNAEAMLKLGLLYEYAKKDKEAFNSFTKAAQKGYAPAYYSLGGCYYSGTGIKKDYAKAKTWYEKVVKNNELTRDEKTSANNMIGVIYENGGYGVKKNEELALQYYKEGYYESYKRLLYKLHPEQKAIDEAKAAAAREQREALRRDNLSLLGDIVNLTGQVVETVNSVKALSDGSAFSNSGSNSSSTSASAPSAASSSSSSSNASADNSNSNENTSQKRVLSPEEQARLDEAKARLERAKRGNERLKDLFYITCSICDDGRCTECKGTRKNPKDGKMIGDGKCHYCDAYVTDEHGKLVGVYSSWKDDIPQIICKHTESCSCVKIKAPDGNYYKVHKDWKTFTGSDLCTICKGNMVCTTCGGTGIHEKHYNYLKNKSQNN